MKQMARELFSKVWGFRQYCTSGSYQWVLYWPL